MSWTSSDDIKAIVQKWWDKGELLATEDNERKAFPRKLTFKVPTSLEMSEKFDLVRRWISDLRETKHVRIEMREFKHKTLGKNSVPSEVWIDTVDDALALINKRRDAQCFFSLLERTKSRAPELVSWVAKNPLRVLNHTEKWERLLSVCTWMKANPKPGIYMRQVDLCDVDTKFIEENRHLLSELFDVVLPNDAVDTNASSGTQFAQRYGFKSKPEKIRFRMLDGENTFFAHGVKPDVELDIESFIQLNPKVSHVFITENETNYLAFPDVPNSMVLFGKGYGFEHLKKVRWLLCPQVIYWGDLDTHGFGILNGLRKYLPLVESLLMDETTLTQHRSMWGFEASQSTAESLQFLSEEELLLYQKLKSQFWQQNVRLEQEKIAWSYACKRIFESVEHNEISRRPGNFTSRPSNTSLSDSDISLYLQPSQCELRVFLKNSGEVECNLDPYTIAIGKIANERKSKYLESFAPIASCSNGSAAERSKQTLDAINSEAPFIAAPLLTVPLILAGIPIQLTCAADLLIATEHGWTVRAIEFARNISETKNAHIIHKLQLFAFLLTTVTGTKPNRLEIVNGAGELVEIQHDGGTAALRVLSQILKVKLSTTKPYSPFGWSKCNGCAYNNRCLTQAEDSNDVALVYGIDEALAKALHLEGAHTTHALIENYDSTKLGSIRRSWGGTITKVGRSADGILVSARALLEKREIALQKPNIIESNNYVMLDLEGLPPYLDEPEKIYLWGIKVFGQNPSSYTPSLAGFDSAGDKQAWLNFLQNSRNAFETLGDIPFIHWHGYEKIQIEKYVEKYGDDSGVAARILANLIDLLTLMRNSFALPLPSYSLKLVEKFVGYSRTQNQFGGAWSMAMYIQAKELSDQKQTQELLEEILLYNSEDLEATWAIFQWLLSYKF